MLRLLRMFVSSTETTSEGNLLHNNVLHIDDDNWQEQADDDNERLNGDDGVTGEAFWPTQRPRRRRRPLTHMEDEERDAGQIEGDANNAQDHHRHQQHQDNHLDFNDEYNADAGDAYDAFAPQPDDFPEMQPFIGLNQDEENELIIRHRIGLTILVISVVFNLCNPLFFLAGGTAPVFSYMNSDGMRSMVYLVGESVGEAGVFSGQLHRVDHCLNRSFDSAALGIIIAAVLLIIAIFTACCAFRWTTGLLRFVRPFLFSGASLGGAIASFFVVRGYSAACNGAFRWYHAEPGLYYIVFGTAITVIHTLVLYAQVSRYPIRKLSLFNNNGNDAVLPEEHNENRALMAMVIGEGNQHNVDGHDNQHPQDLEEELLPIHNGDDGSDILPPHSPTGGNGNVNVNSGIQPSPEGVNHDDQGGVGLTPPHVEDTGVGIVTAGQQPSSVRTPFPSTLHDSVEGPMTNGGMGGGTNGDSTS